MELAQGDILGGKYRVERLLGRGGMGAVFAATHLELDELVAIKILHGDAQSAVGMARFQREARAAVRLKSEHVARVLDVDRLPDGNRYMVLEYLEGQDSRQAPAARADGSPSRTQRRTSSRRAKASPRRTRSEWSTATSSSRISFSRTAPTVPRW